MDDERARILRMVSEGAVSPEEAADLLEAIQPARQNPGNSGQGGSSAPSWTMNAVDRGSRRTRHLVILVKEGDESRVNVRIPLGLTSAAGKFIPRQAHGFLSKYDINLTEFLEQAGTIDSGTVLEVKEGTNRVLIAVE